MLKKLINYTDLDGNPASDFFYFNLNAPEVAKLEKSRKGGLIAYLEEFAKAEDGFGLIEGFTTIIAAAYGERSEDGKRLVKTPEISEGFAQTDAYSELFEEFLTNPTAMPEFMEAVIPTKLAKKLEAAQALAESSKEKSDDDDRPLWIKEDREPTKTEQIAMTREQLLEIMHKKTR